MQTLIIRRFSIAGITASLLFTACQAEELSAYQGTTYENAAEPVAVQLPQPLLGEPPMRSDEWSYTPEASLYAERVPASNTGGWTIDTANRQLARAFYNSVYMASLNTPIGWTGNHNSCNAGTTSSDFKDAVVARINYFRAMAGVPANITLNSTPPVHGIVTQRMAAMRRKIPIYP
jgi:hypothetical protein